MRFEGRPDWRQLSQLRSGGVQYKAASYIGCPKIISTHLFIRLKSQRQNEIYQARKLLDGTSLCVEMSYGEQPQYRSFVPFCKSSIATSIYSLQKREHIHCPILRTISFVRGKLGRLRKLPQNFSEPHSLSHYLPWWWSPSYWTKLTIWIQGWQSISVLCSQNVFLRLWWASTETARDTNRRTQVKPVATQTNWLTGGPHEQLKMCRLKDSTRLRQKIEEALFCFVIRVCGAADDAVRARFLLIADVGRSLWTSTA